MTYYYISIGTNIVPEKNAILIIENLCKYFGEIYLYPFVYTKAINLDTSSNFLNSLAVLKSHLDINFVKLKLTEIEESLGRDKNDPMSSLKDRVADLDILAKSDNFDLRIITDTLEPYEVEVLKGKNKFICSSLPIKGPSTINLYCSPCNKGIIENKFNGI